MRLGTLLPRAVLVGLVWVLATAAFTFAADTQILGPSRASTRAPAQPPELAVPSVTGQAFVFAKGMLEDAGFAWRVEGPVHGFAGNRVLAQSPAAGTHVVDTGAPTIALRLVRGRYAQQGAPQDTSSYRGTRVELAGLTTPSVPHAPRVKPAIKRHAKKPAAHKPATKPAAHKPAKKPAVRKPVKKQGVPAKRPPAFRAPGVPKEPLDEITLPARADRLAAWIATRPRPTNANVQRWFYQHAWIVTGANFGWWHGAQALERLIAVDRSVERIWGVGQRSEVVARAALARVRRLSR
ncbi:MAG: PASTA domain-containing protein [Gaiellaceae bacterium]